MTDHDSVAPSNAPQPDDWLARYARHQQREAELFAPNKEALLDALASSGVTHVVVTFDGYGDAGQIENIEVKAGDETVPMPETQVELIRALWGEAEIRRSRLSVAEAIETLAYDLLNQAHPGWENNDGAYGDISFDVAQRSITLDHNERYTATQNYQHHF